jgi:hypothetical protein
LTGDTVSHVGIFDRLCEHTILVINGPMIYTAPYIMLLMRANPLPGQAGGGGGLEIKTLLGPVKCHRAVSRVPFGAQKDIFMAVLVVSKKKLAL